MNKFFLLLPCLALPILLNSCTAGRNSNDSEDFSLYYSYKDNMKGIDVYCWKQQEGWYSGILPGTNRLKTPSEIEWLQDNLPCPIKKMKEILGTYDDTSREHAFVCIVSNPPKEEELTHDVQLIYSNLDTYEWLYSQLGLEFTLDNGQLPVPGEERIWWYQSFDSEREQLSFAETLLEAGANSVFKLGKSYFSLPLNYELNLINFSGHIEADSSKNEDIFNSKYDYFEFKFVFFNNEKGEGPNFDRVDLFFYPIYGNNDIFSNEGLAYTLYEENSGAYDISFLYSDYEVMKIHVSSQSNNHFNQNELISELITNFELLF